MEQPLVSVVVPVFNGESHIAEAIESVLEQTYRPIELIVVDDGSTDGTATIVSRFESLAMLVRQPNAGTGAARNRGIAEARGPLIGHLDADDVWHPEKLRQQVAVLEADPRVDIVSGHVDEFYSPELSLDERGRIRAPRAGISSCPMSAIVHRREVLERVGLWETGLQLGQDLSWFLRATEAGVSVHILPHVVTYRRLHATNKGLRLHEFASDRLRVLKASLDRRRSRADTP